MDDNRTQATSAYQSGYKHVSGCDIKRDSSFLSFGISPSKTKLISDAITGIRLFPGQSLITKINKAVLEKKESSCHHGHIRPSITYPLIADSEYFTRRFSWLFFLSTALLFLRNSLNFVLRRCI